MDTLSSMSNAGWMGTLVPTRKPRRRRTGEAIHNNAMHIVQIINGITRCRFSVELTESIRREFQLEAASIRWQETWQWDLLHELELIIEKFWHDHARFTVWPSNSEIREDLTSLISLAANLKTLLSDGAFLKARIIHADLINGSRQHGIVGMFDLDQLNCTLDDLIARGSLAREQPLGRETKWKMRSNGQNRPLDRFLGEVIRFWYLDCGKPVDIHSMRPLATSTVLAFSTRVAKLAGHRSSVPALRIRLIKVLKEMDANDEQRRLNGEFPTMNWKVV